MSTSRLLQEFVPEFDRKFDAYLKATDISEELFEAVRYSALAPGKRIRPWLVVSCCEVVGGRREDSWPAAAAMECIHAFSLVHDDLPALDNDDLRRGRPTTHRQFGEAMAILAGDALVMLAFEIAGRHIEDLTCARDVILELASAAGWGGMIGGQAADIRGHGNPPNEELTRRIHQCKTARLFAASCHIGGIVGCAGASQLAELTEYGRNLGLAFQIADDLLDVTSCAEVLGKKAGKDSASGKQTYPACVGVEASQKEVARLVEAAIGALGEFGKVADPLREMARYAGSRNY